MITDPSVNNMIRRSRMEIYIDILKAVGEGKQKPTNIMYKANITWIRMKGYIEYLVNQGFLLKVSGDKFSAISLTPRGKDILWFHKKIENEKRLLRECTSEKSSQKVIFLMK